MKSTVKTKRFILNVFQEKCPKCVIGHVFKQNVSLLKLPIMNEECENCKYHFDREPGYFLGAMYISYGLAIFQGIITFFLLHLLFPNLSTTWLSISVIAVIALCGRKNYKLSRVIYIHIFPW